MKHLPSRLRAIGVLALTSVAWPVRADPSPSPAAAPALRLPQPGWNGIARAQCFDYHVADPSLYPAHTYFVWGAKSPRQPAGIVAAKYLPIGRDADRRHDLSWYRQFHPDWVMYQADRTTPAWGFTYSSGSLAPLDFSNPAVRAFYFDTLVLPAVRQGYPMIGFDNVELTNWDRRSGHYDQGKWIQVFDGRREDPKYADAVIAWLQYLQGRLHPLGVAVAANVTFPSTDRMFDAFRRAVAAVDLWVDEAGFTHHRDANIGGREWEQKVAILREVLPHKLYQGINEMTGRQAPPGEHQDVAAHDYGSKLADASPRQVEFAIASFLIVREQGSMLTLTGQDEYGTILDRPELHVDLGAPAEPPHRLSSGLWLRRYQRGLVLVNPSSSTPASFPLPAGEWRTLQGQRAGPRLDLGPNTGSVLSAN